MKRQWTPQDIAQNMLDVLPVLGRVLAVRMRETGNEEATMRQIGTLMQLREQPITTSELAKRHKVSLQSASVLVQGLVERGWITRIPDAKDRRQWLLQVTPEGAESAEAAKEQFNSIVAEILSDLPPEALNAAGVFLPALDAAVKARLTPDLNNEQSTPIATTRK